MSVPSLNLLHTRPDSQRLAVWATRHGLLNESGDLGYALHALLHAAFGDKAPQPFRYVGAEQGLLAYTAMSAEEISQKVALADVDVSAALGLGATSQHGGFSARLLPTRWAVGHVLGFEVRVRPVIREGKTGKERDAFLAAVGKSGDSPVDRNDVYVQWLKDQLGLRSTGGAEPWQGGAEVLDARLENFRLLDVMRQTHASDIGEKRRRHAVAGPDAVIAGELRVADPAAFAHLLARGVGRHRAFGFGLLLLRPAGRSGQ
jgi:CRISPR system Cascade subunit CasE